MRLTKEEARAYKGYALTPKQLIEKAKKFYDDLTPEERDEEYITFLSPGFKVTEITL